MELSNFIMFYGGIVFPMIMVMGLFVIHVIVYRIMGFLCLLLTLCLTVRSSSFELLIAPTLVQ